MEAAIFYDVENLRHTLVNHFSPQPRIPEVCAKIKEYLKENFSASISKAGAYGDFLATRSISPQDFQSQGVEAKLVSNKLARKNAAPASGADRADMAIGLDMLELALSSSCYELFILVSGDSDFSGVVSRVRQTRGIEVIVISTPEDMSQELRNTANKFVNLAEILGQNTQDFKDEIFEPDTYDYTSIIRLLISLEDTLPFVGLSYVITQVLTVNNCLLGKRENKQALVNNLIELGLLSTYQQDNPNNPSSPVTACELDRTHPEVINILNLEEPDSPEKE